MKKYIFLLLLVTSCNIKKEASKTKNDIDFSESIKTETFRKGDTVSFLVPKYKDTTIYVTNRQGTTVRTIYDKQGGVSNIDCYASTIKELSEMNSRLLDQSKIKNQKKQEGMDHTFMLYIAIGFIVVLLIKR
jgi:hypothetical protein